jgi:hypothetical protein
MWHLGIRTRISRSTGWVYNPGSLEACNVEEYFNRRGAYLVEIGEDGHRAELKREYQQRRIVRQSFDVTGQETPEALHQALMSQFGAEMVGRPLQLLGLSGSRKERR